MLRPAQIADFATVTSWVNSPRACELWAGSSHYFPFDLTTLPEALGFSQDNTLAFMQEGQLAAFGQLFSKDHSRAHLARIVVNPELRGRGLGLAFVQALIEKARAAGFVRVSLNVDDLNPVAIALYQKLGFYKATRPEGQISPEGSSYMEKVF